MHKITINSTEKEELIDITRKIEEIIEKSKIENGLVNIYVPHATCSIIINENYDPNVCKDILKSLSSLIPEGKWLHDKVDNNAAAHIKASIIGPSETIPIKDGKLTLGKWQSIMLADFDGPRKREVIIKVIKG